MSEADMQDQTTVHIPPLLDVNCPTLKQVGHANETLFVRYNDGRLLCYPGVTVAQYQALGEAGQTYGKSMLRHLRLAILPGRKGILVEEAGTEQPAQ